MAPAWFAATASGLIIAKVFSILNSALDRLANRSRRRTHSNAGVFHRRDFVFSLPAASGNDRARVTHASSRRSGLPGDESDDGLLHVGLDIRSRGLLRGAANLADHDDGVRVSVFIKETNRVSERGADDRVASNADAGRLSDPQLGQLPDCFISERPRSRHYA